MHWMARCAHFFAGAEAPTAGAAAGEPLYESERVKLLPQLLGRLAASAPDVGDIAWELMRAESIERMLLLCVDRSRVVNGAWFLVDPNATDRQTEFYMADLMQALLSVPGAAGYYLAHNHPCGYGRFSCEDVDLTDNAHTVGEAIGIRLIDHILLAGDAWVSARRAWMC